MRTRVILVGCGRKKAICSLCPARHLYLGNVFKARAAYADATKDTWFILSAKHGLVQKTQMLAPYDLDIKKLRPAQRAAWGRDAVETLVRSLFGGPHEYELEVHAGALYYASLLVPAETRGFTMRWPVAGLGIGEQLRWYIDHMATHSGGNPYPPPPRFREEDCGGVLGADGNVYSDADPGL